DALLTHGGPRVSCDYRQVVRSNRRCWLAPECVTERRDEARGVVDVREAGGAAQLGGRMRADLTLERPDRLASGVGHARARRGVEPRLHPPPPTPGELGVLRLVLR